MAIKVIVSAAITLFSGYFFYKSWFDSENLRRELIAYQEARSRETLFKILALQALHHSGWVWLQRVIAVGLVLIALWAILKILVG